MTKWDYKFLKLAEYIADNWSKDPHIKVGAVVVDTKNPAEYYTGYNGFPKKIIDSEERYKQKEIKHKIIIHAELNAILNSKRCLAGFTLYSTRFPCLKCVLAIIQVGIGLVVTYAPSKKDVWKHKSDYLTIVTLLIEADVPIVLIENDTVISLDDFKTRVLKSAERET